jgi:hypothetical protein
MFNAGNKIEAMKHLTFHRSLHCMITSTLPVPCSAYHPGTRDRKTTVRVKIKSTYQWNFAKPKKGQNPGLFRNLVLFSDLPILLSSILTGHEKCLKCITLYSLSDSQDIGRLKLRHFEDPLRLPTSGISQI